MALIRSIATVGSWTMGSRVLGFLRDILIARYLGAGPVADAFGRVTRTAFLAALLSFVLGSGAAAFVARRLTRPLEVFWHPQHMRQWAHRHPGAVIISKEGREGPGYDPVLESLFRGTTSRVWIVPEKQKKTGGNKAGGTKQQVQ